MGLLTILRKQKWKEKEARVLLLGLDNAGKTTILKRLLNENTITVSPTFGFQIRTINVEGLHLTIWDIGGQKTLRSFWKNYFESTEAIVWVVDSLDESRLLECKHQLHELLLEEKLLNISLLILANKSDAAGSLDAKTIEQLLHLDELKSRHYCILSVSAITGDGIQEAINWLASDLRESKMGILSN
ncbi:GTP-binding protein involved in beta-tubulin folding Alp41 [Schizosaccharomyces osmophilus]|uniref:GTP-binding protein involved in beta-tubulin folding Alp41 n=1 Tax=Schizosaccharomyces osmophilus TaxID=2545709 RepID=A0AAE9WB38_9SCHI|nr:GTP-binding protein involved in beta-tubulin folding Alp41 [Schizosaccharomyces osmophilus]WBW72027.1 GTP-binding protein involved in beta-tubulin folding Alp41 [Schizosaccharomyces osmophilus]